MNREDDTEDFFLVLPALHFTAAPLRGAARPERAVKAGIAGFRPALNSLWAKPTTGVPIPLAGF